MDPAYLFQAEDHILSIIYKNMFQYSKNELYYFKWNWLYDIGHFCLTLQMHTHTHTHIIATHWQVLPSTNWNDMFNNWSYKWSLFPLKMNSNLIFKKNHKCICFNQITLSQHLIIILKRVYVCVMFLILIRIGTEKI